MDSIESFIRDRILKLIEAKGVSEREMSLLLGQNHSYINKILNGKNMPSYEGLKFICDECNITISEFFNECNENPIDVEKLLVQARKMKREPLKNLIEIAKYINE